MLHVFLILLKILAFILLLLLALVLIILVTPFRYSFSLDQEDEHPLRGIARVTWFFKALSFRADYIGEDLTYQVRILGIQVLGNDPDFLAGQEEKRKKREQKEKGTQDKQEPAEDKQPDGQTDRPADGAEAGYEDLSREELLTAQSRHEEVLEAEEETAKEDSVSDRTASGRIETDRIETDRTASGRTETKTGPGKADRFNSRIEKLKKKLNRLKERVRRLKEKRAEMEALYKKLNGEALVSKGKVLLKKILRHVLPRRLEGQIRFGFDDPALTGYTTAICAAMYPLYGKHFKIEPDFSRLCYAGHMEGSGLVRPAYFLYLIIWLLLDRHVRRLVCYLLHRNKRKKQKNRIHRKKSAEPVQ